MVKFTYVTLAFLTTAVLGCRTPDPVHAPKVGVALVDLSGTLKLVDGTPVPGADIAVRCGGVSNATTTDVDGAFAVAAVPEGPCTITSSKAGVEKHVRISKSLLGDKPKVSLEIPAQTRVVLSGLGRRWVIDPSAWVETLSIGTSTIQIETTKHTFSLTKADCGSCKPRVNDLRRGAKIPIGIRDQRIEYVTIEEVKQVPVMPIALRPPPRMGAIYRLSFTGTDFRPAAFAPRDRHLVLLGHCNLKAEDLEELEHLAATYRTSGLEVSVIQTASCPKPLAQRTNVRQLRSFEAGWALGAKPGDVVILDQDGKVVFRRKLDKTSAVGTTTFDDAVSFLDRTWPALAARRRISVTKATSVKTAEAVRLTGQVDAQLKANRFPQAHRLLDRLVLLSPDLPEAHKLRALVRARLGDYTGAMQEVAWWRSSFGCESAEELEDKVKQASKGRLGALRVAR
jgi:hypothetical protein